MKRVIAILLSLAFFVSMSACGNNDSSSLSAQEKASESVENIEPIHLTNKMTETELSKGISIALHCLTLLKQPKKHQQMNNQGIK